MTTSEILLEFLASGYPSPNENKEDRIKTFLTHQTDFETEAVSCTQCKDYMGTRVW